jgi:hypothetical protein
MPGSVENLVKTAIVVYAAVTFGPFVASSAGLTSGTLAFTALSSAVTVVVGGTLRNALGGGNAQASFTAQAQGRDQVVRSSVANRTVVYGRAVVSGPLVFAAVAGEGNSKLHLVIPLAGHEIDAVEEIYFNDQALGMALSEAEPSKTITNGVYDRKASFTLHTGTLAQAANADLVAADVGWTSAHRLAGVAYLVTTLTFDSDAFPTGIPNIKCKIRGKKLYDPRTGLTTWSANTALACRDYLTSTYGLEATSGEIDDTLVAAAANVCDESVTVVGGTESRYTCNGVVDLGDTPRSIMEAMLSSMAGQVVWSGGKYLLYAGAYTAPTVTLTADDLRGPVSVRPRHGRKDLFNAVRGTFVDPASFWQPTDFPTVSNSTYATNDGGQVIWRDTALPFTTSSATAQRIAKLMLERSRQGITVELQCKLTAFKVATLDTVMVTLSQLGWSAKEFKVLEWTFAPEGGVNLVLQEETAASYNWNSGMQTVVDPAPDTNLGNPFLVATPASLTVTSGTSELLLQTDGTVISRMKAVWPEPTDVFTDKAELQFKKSTDSSWQALTGLDPQSVAWCTPVQDRVAYDLRLRFVNTYGVRSAWLTTTHTVIGKSEPPATVASLQISEKTLSWPAVSDVDLDGYRLKFQYGTNFEWGTASQIHEGLVTSSPYDMLVVPPGTITIMVRAVDTSGNESADSAYVIVNLGNTPVANVVETYDYKAAVWPGTYSGATVSGGNLVSTQSDLFYNADLSDFYKQDAAAFYNSNYDAITWTSSGWTPTAPGVGSKTTAAWTIDGNAYTVEYRKTGPLPFFGETSDFFFGADASAFYSGAGAWSTWPGSIEADAEEYQWRVTTVAGLLQNVISAFTISVDVPDKTQRINNAALGSSGTRLTAAIGNFYAIQNIQLTLQGGSTAVSLEITDKSATLGPLIIAKNSAGTGVAATVDAFLQGY